MTAQQEGEGVLSQSLHRRVPTTSYSQHQHLMHPPLFKPHPDCEELVKALVTCHEQNPTAKFWGACNDPKVLMDQCFREEKNRKRNRNLEKARASKLAWEQRLAQRRIEAEGASATKN